MRKPLAILSMALVLGACASPPGTPRGDPVPVRPASAGWNTQALDELFRYVASQKSTGLVIVHDNQVIADQR